MADGITQNYSKKERAAVLVAEDDLTDEEIAAAVGVTRKTLHNWKQLPEFVADVEEQVSKIQAGMRRLAIAKKHKRLKVLNDLHGRSLAVIADRADRHAAELEAAESQPNDLVKRMFGDNVPTEAATGLLVRQESINAQGMKTVNWSVDTGLMKEIRALHEQAAKELGQWSEKSELEVGGSLKREYVIITEDVT